MPVFTVLLPSGREWTPTFVSAIDHDRCIGCGRCFKVCRRGVLELVGLDEDGAVVDAEDEDEFERKVMLVSDPEACIGCGACGTVCTPGPVHSRAGGVLPTRQCDRGVEGGRARPSG